MGSFDDAGKVIGELDGVCEPTEGDTDGNLVLRVGNDVG